MVTDGNTRFSPPGDPAPVYSDGPPRFAQGVVARDVLFTVSDTYEYGLLITPECDLDQDKASALLFVALFDALWMYQSHARGISALVDSSGNFVHNPSEGRGKPRDFISNIQLHKHQRYYWLDPLPGADAPLIADFQYVSCVPVGDAQSLSLVANVVDPVRAAVATRYAAYVGRIGVDDPDKDALRAWLDSAFTRTFPGET